jgi:heme-degrading monooxygenase HmoA
MFVLHVAIKVKAGQGKSAERVFSGPFKTAISAQEGFRSVQFLRPIEGGAYVLSIAFENQALQQKWVATDLHQQVWPRMEEHFDDYSITTYAEV